MGVGLGPRGLRLGIGDWGYWVMWGPKVIKSSLNNSENM